MFFFERVDEGRDWYLHFSFVNWIGLDFLSGDGSENWLPWESEGKEMVSFVRGLATTFTF